jgi:hypothetical protein
MTVGKQKRAGIPLQIRFPDDGELKARIESAAKAGRRSMNAEIMARLEYTFANRMTVHESGYDVEGPEYIDAPNGGKTLEQRMQELEARVSALEGQKRKKG